MMVVMGSFYLGKYSSMVLLFNIKIEDICRKSQ